MNCVFLLLLLLLPRSSYSLKAWRAIYTGVWLYDLERDLGLLTLSTFFVFFLVWDLERDLEVVDLVFMELLDFLDEAEPALFLKTFFLDFEFDLDLLLDLTFFLPGLLLLVFFFLEGDLDLLLLLELFVDLLLLLLAARD